MIVIIINDIYHHCLSPRLVSLYCIELFVAITLPPFSVQDPASPTRERLSEWLTNN